MSDDEITATPIPWLLDAADLAKDLKDAGEFDESATLGDIIVGTLEAEVTELEEYDEAVEEKKAELHESLTGQSPDEDTEKEGYDAATAKRAELKEKILEDK